MPVLFFSGCAFFNTYLASISPAAYIITRIDEAAVDYSQQFDALMAMLREQGDRAGDISRFLALRLDFNEFHERRQNLGASGAVVSSPITAR